MVISTSGIVLKSVKYGETSCVVTVYTDRFGIQAYLVNGIRTGAKSSKAHLYQPASVLEMEVYHNQFKNLQRVKEARWKKVYQSIFSDVIKNAVASFIVEVFQRSIIAEEQNEALYHFIENQLFVLDQALPPETANMPVLFMASLPAFLGFAPENNFSEKMPFFDLREGSFVAQDHEAHVDPSPVINEALSQVLSSAQHLQPLRLNGEIRRRLLYLLENYYQYHVDGFSQLKTLRVLETILRN